MSWFIGAIHFCKSCHRQLRQHLWFWPDSETRPRTAAGLYESPHCLVANSIEVGLVVAVFAEVYFWNALTEDRHLSRVERWSCVHVVQSNSATPNCVSAGVMKRRRTADSKKLCENERKTADSCVTEENNYYIAWSKKAHCVSLTTSAKLVNQFVRRFDTFQRRSVLSASFDCIFVNGVVKSGDVWQKSTNTIWYDTVD